LTSDSPSAVPSSSIFICVPVSALTSIMHDSTWLDRITLP
jgi:hypothetical protein